MSRFLSRSSRLIETFETNRDKSRFFEIFVGNQDFVEINQDFVKKNRDFFSLDRDFNNLWRLFLDFFGPFGPILDRDYTVISLFLDRDREILEKSTKSTHNHKSLDLSRKILILTKKYGLG